MAVKESNLPGIGRRYELDVRNRTRIVAVVHHTGRRDLYVYGRPDGEPSCWAELDDDDARRLGAILAGSSFRPPVAEGVEEVMGRLVIDWMTIDDTSPVIGETIGALQIRSRTGMTVVGIVRGGKPIVNPGPETELCAGDRLVVVGPLNVMSDLVAFVTG